MQTLIAGLDLKRGDEVVVSDQSYPRMLTAWDQRARRDGVVVKRISLGGPNPPPEDVVARFRGALTERTRMVEITRVVNLTGNILPVRDVVALAREHGAETFVDGAHAFAHFPFRRDDLGCGYYATSLHKWLLAPVGTGFLYVRKASIPKIWPLMAAESMSGDIRKFEEIGTHPAANHNAIAAARAMKPDGPGSHRAQDSGRVLQTRPKSAVGGRSPAHGAPVGDGSLHRQDRIDSPGRPGRCPGRASGRLTAG